MLVYFSCTTCVNIRTFARSNITQMPFNPSHYSTSNRMQLEMTFWKSVFSVHLHGITYGITSTHYGITSTHEEG